MKTEETKEEKKEDAENKKEIKVLQHLLAFGFKIFLIQSTSFKHCSFFQVNFVSFLNLSKDKKFKDKVK